MRRGVFLDLETIDRGDLDRGGLEASLAAWDWHAFTRPEEVVKRIEDARVVVTNKCYLGREQLAAARRLELIAVAATGTNNIDLAAAGSLGITVCNIRDYCSEAVAQHVITLVLNLLTGQPWYLDRVRRGEWSVARQFCLLDRPIREAKGLAFGVVGYGSLGRAVAAKAEALGMDVLVAERKGQRQRAGRLPFEGVLSCADVVSIHCPLNDETRDLITLEDLRAMKQEAVLINTARGGIVNERDLADALRRGLIAGAAVDSLEPEPPPIDHPLLAADIPNLLVTPHNAWASRSARQSALDQLAQVVTAFTRGAPVNVIEPRAGASTR